MASAFCSRPAGVAAGFVAAAVIGLLPLAAQAAAPAELTAAERSRLLGLGMPVLLPGQLPEGFQPVQVTATACPPAAPRLGACREGPSYEIVYADAQGSCLLVLGIGGGVGGGAAAFEYTTRTPLLGEVAILFGEPSRSLSGPPANQRPRPEQLEQVQPGLYSFPAPLLDRPLAPLFSLQAIDSDGEGPRDRCGPNRRITPAVLEQALQSLQRLR